MATPSLLFALHLSDGVCDPSTLNGGLLIGGGFVVAVCLLAVAFWNLAPEETPKASVLSAAFFVASLIHIPIGVGSAHLLLNGVVGVVLRTRAALAIVPAVLLQALLFGHGGITTIGLNASIMTLPAILAGLFRLPAKRTAIWGFTLGVLAAGGALVLNCLALSMAGANELAVLAKVVFVANLPFVVIEGLMVMAIVSYLAIVKPEWLTRRLPPA